jgi:uncharacterized protein YndB with AHSA1/START domain
MTTTTSTTTMTIGGTTTARIDRDARAVVIERVFDAPRERVFRAWTSCDAVSNWWAPTGWTVPYCEMDFRPGGVWRYGMQGPPDDPELGHVVSHGKATYKEIVEPVLLVMVDEFVDGDGNALPGMPVMTATVDFVDLDGRTKLIDTATYDSVEDLEKVIAMGMLEGTTQSWDRLEAMLESAAD